MKFSQIAKGTFARRAIPLQLGDQAVQVDVRPLLFEERGEIARFAREYATSKGVADPNDNDEAYVIGKQAYQAFLGCVDHDSDEKDPKPFFDGGIDDVLKGQPMVSDHIAYLCEQIDLWEDECTPRALKMSNEEFIARTVRIAGGDMTAFLSLRPGTQQTFVRTLAGRHLTLLADRSFTGSSSPDDTENSVASSAH